MEPTPEKHSDAVRAGVAPRLRLDAALDYALLGVSALAVAWFVTHSIRAASLPFPLDYGEGPLLDQARQIARGANVYRPRLDDYPFTVSNYPPLYPSLLAACCSVFGWSYGAARGLTIVAACACAVLVGAIVRAVSADRRAPFIAAATFVASPYLVFWASFVRIDLVALALSLGAVCVAMTRPDRRATPFVCAALVLGAALTRQSHLLAAPLAISGALFVQRPMRAVQFAAMLAIGVVAAFFALNAATHGGFLLHVVTANVNHFDFGLLRFFLGDLAVTSGALIVLAFVHAATTFSRRSAASVLVALYLSGTFLSALTIGKVGSSLNYFLELAASTAILGALAISHGKNDAHAWRRRAAAIALGLQIAWMVGVSVLRPESMDAKLAMRAEFESLRQVLAAEPGEVLADETMGMLPVTGHAILLQPFEMTQLSRQGIWDQSRLVTDLRAARFALILINDGPRTPESWTRERWTPEMLAAIHARYEAVGALADATLYRPRKGD